MPELCNFPVLFGTLLVGLGLVVEPIEAAPLHQAASKTNLSTAKFLSRVNANKEIRTFDRLETVYKFLTRNEGEIVNLIHASQTKVYDSQARDELSPNDIKAFVYHWFANFDHQVALEQILPFLGNPVDMGFPDFPVRSEADFVRWYQGVVDNIQWNSHDISNLKVLGDQGSGWTVSMDIHWRARTYDGAEYDNVIHQEWRVARSNDGSLVINFHRSEAIN